MNNGVQILLDWGQVYTLILLGGCYIKYIMTLYICGGILVPRKLVYCETPAWSEYNEVHSPTPHNITYYQL